jgi:hypothetical protein
MRGGEGVYVHMQDLLLLEYGKTALTSQSWEPQASITATSCAVPPPQLAQALVGEGAGDVAGPAGSRCASTCGPCLRVPCLTDGVAVHCAEPSAV